MTATNDIIETPVQIDGYYYYAATKTYATEAEAQAKCDERNQHVRQHETENRVARVKGGWTVIQADK